MIARGAPSGVHLITQPDHAHLARTVMERAVVLTGHPRRESILHAVAEHDNGWAEEDAEPTVNRATGQIADFISVPVAVRHRVWPRGIGRLAHPWASALVAHHAITVYDRFRPDAAWTPFFADLEMMRARDVRASGLSFDDLAADYPYLRLGDLISLAFCTGTTDEQRVGSWRVKLAGSCVVVTPDAFGGESIPIEIAAREIPRSSFASDSELCEAVRRSGLSILRGHVAAAPNEFAERKW
jgi:Protein of unknown function (DUF3891)